MDINEIIKYLKNLKLLYVEDNQDSREMTKLILDDFFDDIIVAVDGEDGYRKFNESDIDIIITDINMPKLNGLEMLQKIKKIDKEVFSIVLSAHNENSFFIESIKIGVDGYLLKPIDFDQFLSVMEKVVSNYKYIYEAKSNLQILKEYQRATDESSIVSKTDDKGIITYVNDKFCEISGYTREELIGKNHNIVRHPDNPKSIYEDMWHTIKDKKEIWHGLVRNRRKDGKSYYVDSVVMPIIDIEGRIKEYVSLRTDVTEILNPLRQLRDAMKNAKDPILFYFKLDKFDMIEEFYDSDRVEHIQSKIAQTLQDRFMKIYEFDKVYQLENGEYAFIVEKAKFFKDKKSFYKKFENYFYKINDEKISVDNIVVDISFVVSIVYENDKRLESAKIGIKKALKKNMKILIANDLANMLQDRAKQNIKKVSMIKKALQDSKIISYFQPIVENSSRNVVKYESLVRLINETGEVLTPYHFLDIAKKSNYYGDITKMVLANSFKALEHSDKEITINLSILDIEDRSMKEMIYELLDRYKDSASKVTFELLEDENVKDFSIVKEFIEKVKSFGVQIAIDDFGSGYSNYERLTDYHPDILKIDGSLIKNIDKDTYSLSIVKSIVTFAKERGIKIVAEFIEDEKVYELVKSLGIDYSQGYYFGKPEEKIA